MGFFDARFGAYLVVAALLHSGYLRPINVIEKLEMQKNVGIQKTVSKRNDVLLFH
jgi:hypothetical protein